MSAFGAAIPRAFGVNGRGGPLLRCSPLRGFVASAVVYKSKMQLPVTKGKGKKRVASKEFRLDTVHKAVPRSLPQTRGSSTKSKKSLSSPIKPRRVDISQLKSAAEAHDARCKELDTELAAAEKQLKSAAEAHDARCKELETELAAAEKQLKSAAEERDELRQELDTQKVSKKALHADFARANADLECARRQCSGLEQERDDLRHELDTQKASKKSLQADFASANAEMESARRLSSILEKERNELRAMNEERGEELNACKAQLQSANDRLAELPRLQLLKLFVGSYSRGAGLTTQPEAAEFVQHAEFEVAVNKAWTSLADAAKRHAKMTPNSKEKLSVVSVVAPPRHGKSLFIDRLQLKAADPLNAELTLVIPVTYNSETPFDADNEVDKLDWFFVARMFHTILRTVAEPRDLVEAMQMQHRDARDFVRYFKDILLQRRPCLEHIVIAIDELTTVLDTVAYHHRKSFIRFLRGLLKISSPRITILFTGFTPAAFETFKSSDIQPIPVYLPEYRPSEMVPLLKALLRFYKQRKEPFPCMIWQCCKTNAGLLGYLVELARVNHHLFRTWEDFLEGSGIKWFKLLGRLAETYCPLVEFHLVKTIRSPSTAAASLKAQMQPNTENPSETQLRLARLLGDVARFKSDSNPYLEPAALLALVHARRKIKGDEKDTKPEEPPFWRLLESVLNSCDMRNCPVHTLEGRGGPDGLCFEMYTLAVINLRSWVLQGRTFCSGCWFHRTDRSVCCRQCAPMSESACFCFEGGVVNSKNDYWIPRTTVRFVTQREDLVAFLTETLYVLFPVDCDQIIAEVAAEKESEAGSSTKEARSEAAPPGTARTFFWPLPASSTSSRNHTIVCGEKVVHEKDFPVWLPTSFPKGAKAEELFNSVQRLQQLQQTVWYRPSKENNQGCDLVGLTYIAEHRTLEITLLELKDRRSISNADTTAKLQSALCHGVWKEFRDNHPDINLCIELVIAGQCDHRFTFSHRPGKSIDECVNEAIALDIEPQES